MSRLRRSFRYTQRRQFAYALQSRPQYWMWRRRWQGIALWLGQRRFATTNRWRSSAEILSIVRQILGSILGQGALAVFLVFGLAALERGLIHRSATMARAFAADQLDPAAYLGLFSTSAQIAGGFLGLYFTAVSVVASTIYARVPGDVRSLIVSAKVGNVYIRIVALFGAVALLLLGAASLKISPGVLNVALVVVLGVVAVMSFVVLGLRAFFFFDPAVLTRYVTQDIERWFQAATPRGYRWHDPSFQAHYQLRAEGALATYTRITALALQAEANHAQGIARLAQVTLALWTNYAYHKIRIPTDSHWFRRTYHHPDWLQVDYSRVGIALETGTPLLPEATPDQFWFEVELRSALLQAFQALLDRDDLSEAILTAESIRGTLGHLGTIAMLDEALVLYREISRRALAKIRATSADAARPLPAPELLRLDQGLIDVASAGLIELLLVQCGVDTPVVSWLRSVPQGRDKPPGYFSLAVLNQSADENYMPDAAHYAGFIGALV